MSKVHRTINVQRLREKTDCQSIRSIYSRHWNQIKGLEGDSSKSSVTTQTLKLMTYYGVIVITTMQLRFLKQILTVSATRTARIFTTRIRFNKVTYRRRTKINRLNKISRRSTWMMTKYARQLIPRSL